MQLTFSRLRDGYSTDKEALGSRNKKAKELRKEGYRVICTTLSNQMKKYDGIGQYNGGICNVYMLDYNA